jgi:hypothetical protein
MEELQNALVAEVGKQLKSDKPNIQYLDVLNRLLGTVNNCLTTNQGEKGVYFKSGLDSIKNRPGSKRCQD